MIGHRDTNRVFRIAPPRLNDDDDTPLGCQRPEQGDLFFAPERGEEGGAIDNGRNAREVRAREICGACPAITRCALHGLEHEDYGIWGGMTEADRRAIGGRGVSNHHGRPGSPATIARRMARSGVPTHKVAEIFEAWGRRLRALKGERAA